MSQLTKSEPVDAILMHLAEIGAGKCSITDETIAQVTDPDLQQVLVGLLIMYEDLSYERVKRERAEAEREQLLEERRRAIVARDHFLAAASHELKTPLATLWLQADRFGEALERFDDARMTPLIGRLRMFDRQIKRINTVVEEMLDVSRITLGHLALRPSQVDLRELARNAMAQFEGAQHQSELSLRAEGAIIGHCDAHRIEQVIANLISNALKYGRGRPVSIRVGAAGAKALIEVRDEGIGISPEDQERIFAPFGRAASVEHYGGLGLGLWISEQIVAASGGAIRVQSAPGEGSTFSVELPREPQP